MRLSAVGQVHFKRGEALCFYEQCIHYDSVIFHPRFGVGRSVIWRGDFITSGASTCRGFLEFSTLQGSSNDSFDNSAVSYKLFRQLVWPPWQLDDDIFAFNIGLGKVTTDSENWEILGKNSHFLALKVKVMDLPRFSLGGMESINFRSRF